MKTPTLEEVKEYFKDALEVKDYSGSSIKVIDLTGIKLSKFGNYLDCSVKNNFTYFWCSEHGYAEITKYKSNNFKTITDSISSLLEYKNTKYGNSALEPLNVFKNKCKVGDRLDDKLSRVKNSSELKKNDVADIIGYLILTCKENNWTNFDEFKD